MTLTRSPLRPVSLEDRYALERGVVLLTGVQALVRLPIDQRRSDRARGLRTATLISGYQGSPLGGYDTELQRRRSLLDAHDIVHQPALNEELAATAIMGSQLAHLRPEPLYDGVVGLWYGKAPGLDRAADAIRHANLMGVDAVGGALVCVGDDAQAKSSTVPSSSEPALYDLATPILVPADPQEVLDLGLHGIALSRSSGCWVGMKVATDVADGAATVEVGPERIEPRLPELVVDGAPFRHVVSARMFGPPLLALERSLHGPRTELARRYGTLNGLNRVTAGGPGARVGVAAMGKTYLDLRQALAALGLDDDALASRGVRLFKVAMPQPLDEAVVREFAAGLDEVVVVEEKRGFLEPRIKELLYGLPAAPRVVGKRDPDGAPLLPEAGALDADQIADAVGRRLRAAGIEARERLPAIAPAPRALPLARTPYFCSGCPHNSSTRVPEGTTVGAGIGCHAMVLLMPDSQAGDVVGVTQMGGEGAQWLGMAPFVADRHFVQNIGDGTFAHSGSLAVRAAVAAGGELTFKLLANAAVAMTGGQEVVGGLSVPQLTHLLAAEGVARTIVTTEDVERYRGVTLAANAELWDRSRIVEAQEVLASQGGVTALIHDQECAAEKRRKRKRGRLEDPPRRVFINERVCEGCGDCGRKSNCLSVVPVETELGRKTAIHQASCNRDYSCLDGDCPSFLTVVPARRRARAPSASAIGPDALPEPVVRVPADDFGMRIAGIGGTGVVTVAQVLATAALLEGRFVRGLDQTGLAQKGGPVVSDVKWSTTEIDGTNRLTRGECDLYLACDPLVGADPANLVVAAADRTIAVVSTAQVATGRQVLDPAVGFPDDLAGRIEALTRAGDGVRLDAQRLARQLWGSEQTANLLLVGAAYQAGALPVGADAIERAIELNGAAVDANVQAFRRGRQAVADPAGFERAVAPAVPEPEPAPAIADLVRARAGSELERRVRRRVADLIGYQDAAYARRYAEAVERVRAAEAERAPDGGTALAEAVAFHLYKLMATKDEYEVARLHLGPEVRRAVEAEFGPGARVRWQLHPPVLRALGLKRKLSLGRGFTPVFWVLRAARRLRGTPFDPFGYAHVRRVDRALLREYEALLDRIVAGLGPARHDLAVEIASLPDLVRGYDQVRLDSVERYRGRLAELRAAFEGG